MSAYPNPGVPADPLPPELEEGEPDTKDDEMAGPDAPEPEIDDAPEQEFEDEWEFEEDEKDGADG